MSISSKTREEAWELLCQHTKSESLIKHALGVEAAVKWYAAKFSEDITLWSLTALLHDFDYEEFPTYSLEPGRPPAGHPFEGCRLLEKLQYPPIVIEAILGHANYSGVPRTSLLAKVLFACDELSGLITASVLVRPDRNIANLQLKSVRKKMKDKAFARGVSREDIELGAAELGIALDEHIQNVITAMQQEATALGLAG